MASTLKIGFVGAGRMAGALARGMIASGRFEAKNIMASHPSHGAKTDGKLNDSEGRVLESLGVRVMSDNAELVAQNDVVFLAVRPKEIRKVASELASIIDADKLVASVALGITIRSLEGLLPSKSRVVRVMPNTPTLVRAGVSGFCVGSGCKAADTETMLDILSTVGFAVQVPEALVDPLTGLSACGPSYMLAAMEALADGGVKVGLPRALARLLAAHTLKGAAALALETGRHPADLKDDIQSPMGASIYAMHTLENSGFRGQLISAVETASNRSRETGEAIYTQDGVDDDKFR